jgi:hypothetical protein
VNVDKQTEQEINPLEAMKERIQLGLDEYLAAVVKRAVDEGIITKDQRNQIMGLASRGQILDLATP